jgi:hypothetical protein
MSRDTDDAFVAIALALRLINRKKQKKRIAAGPKSGTEDHRSSTHKTIS